MRRVENRRSSNAGWATAAIVLLLVAAGLAAYAFWPGGSPSLGPLSCGGDTTTTTANPATISTSTPPPPATAPSGVSTSTPPPTPSIASTTTEPLPVLPLDFDTNLAMSHIQMLAGEIGVRKAGDDNEQTAALYAANYLESLGYAVEITEVLLPDGGISRNVQAVKTGTSPLTILIGAHLDSKPPSPGANDDASGVAVVLELARDFHDADVTAGLAFVLFGAEEFIDADPDHSRFGSRQFVQDMTDEERADLVGMISVDMIAYGEEILVRNMGRSSPLLGDMLLTYAEDLGLPVRYSLDEASTGCSDHEAFEAAGYPVAWLECYEDPHYHTEGDTYEHCDPDLVRQTGEMLRGFLLGLTEADLWMLANARELD